MHTLRRINFKMPSISWKCLLTQAWINNQNIEHNTSETKIERLKERSLLSVTGQDAASFLQSLITNDMNNLLKEKQQSLYTMFLNLRGRVVHDGIVYKTQDPNCFLVETDISSVEMLRTHLSLYKVHSKVSLESEEHNYSTWAVFNPNKVEKVVTGMACSGGLLDDSSDLSILEEINLGDEVIVCCDPRITSLGTRIVAPRKVDVAHLIKLNGFILTKARPGDFKLLRYKLGIGEGIHEFEYGKYFPRELNCDYLKALSNKKDDYLGKIFSNVNSERRIMPVTVIDKENHKFRLNSPLIDLQRKKKNPLGHVRGVQGLSVIAIVRVPSLDEEKEMRIGSTLVHCVKPFWWPDFSKSFPGRQNKSFS